MTDNWKIYGIFDKRTQECIYVGRTSMSLKNRWFYHTWPKNKKASPIWKHLQVNGSENFYIEGLKLCKNREEWCEWEQHLILELSPKYNIRLGGEFT